MRRNEIRIAAALSVVAAVALAWIVPPAVGEEKKSDKDILLEAMQDELARSMDRLQLEDMVKPYLIAYTANAGTMYQVGATFGALTGESEAPMRSLGAEVRVGDYVLDNTNYSGGGFYFPGGFFGGGLCLEDDYDAIRYRLWLSTDSRYKSALESLAGKKAFLQNQEVKDRPDDLQKVESVVHLEPVRKPEWDQERWKAAVKKISAVFREYPDIHDASASVMGMCANRYLVNSEGFRCRTGQYAIGLIVNADTQCDDGMSLSNYAVFAARSGKELPTEEVMLAEAKKVADTLMAQRAAPLAEDYTGPVLFEGQAAAEFFLQCLGKNLGAVRQTLGSRGFNPFGGMRLNDKLGKRILPRFIDVFDDPTKKEYGGKPLLGGYAIDDEGVRGRAIRIVEKGKLRTLCTTRVPTKEIKESNGHCRGGRAGISNLIVESSNKIPIAALKTRLIEMASDEDLDYGILVRKTSSAMSGGGGRIVRYSFGSRGGSISLPQPMEIYRVYVEDGREELIRGASFSAASLRILRDIVATGDDTTVYSTMEGLGSIVSVAVPSVLLEELEMKKPPEDFPKPPHLQKPGAKKK
ncbi:MAG: metallopeptidase TldD-related protein [Planctomycetota bacterium]